MSTAAPPPAVGSPLDDLARRFPGVVARPHAKAWLELLGAWGRSPHTVAAYARSLAQFFAYWAYWTSDVRSSTPAGGGAARADVAGAAGVDDIPRAPEHATRGDVAGYLVWLRHAARAPHGPDAVDVVDTPYAPYAACATYAAATLQQRLTALRRWFEYLLEEGVRTTNPVARGRYAPGQPQRAVRGPVAVPARLPRIPSESEWEALLTAARAEPLRNRVMLALQYEGALRREELVRLDVADVDPAHRTVTIRAETTKGRARGRVVTYTPVTGVLYAAYLQERRQLDRRAGPLFLSVSRRNRGARVSVATWDKVVRRLRTRAGVRDFTTHTPRHLCLTDLARAGWDLQLLATYAGHRNPQTTLRYIHLSGREVVLPFARAMARHAERLQRLAASLA